MKFFVLNRNNDFRRIYARGKSEVHPFLITYVLKNRRRYTRVGITASKKIGGAVKRNRVRRIIREAYRRLIPDVAPGYDIIFVARVRTLQKKSTDVLYAMKKQLAALKILPPNGKA